MIRRAIGAAINALGAREVEVILSTDGIGRDGHILEPGGCELDRYRDNPILLWQHNPAAPIGRVDDIAVYGNRIAARVSFAAPGISATADEVCGLVKSGIVSTVSVGFDVIEAEPLDPRQGARGGLRISKWELLECSFVSIPADPGAVVTARAGVTARSSYHRRSAMVAEHKALMENLGESIDDARNHLYAAARAHERGDKRGVEAAHRRCQRALDEAREAYRDLGALAQQLDFDATHTIQTSAGTGIDHGSDTGRDYRRRQVEKLRLQGVAIDPLPLPSLIYSPEGGAAGWTAQIRQCEEEQRAAHCAEIVVGARSLTRAERLAEVARLRRQ